MKKLIPAAIIAAALFSCNPSADKGKFTLSGELKSAKDQNIYLEELYFSDKQPEVLDTGEIKNGKFTISALAPEEGLFRLRTEDGKNAYLFISEDGKMNFTANAAKTGPANNFFSGAANSSLRKILLYADSIGKLIAGKNSTLSGFLQAGVKETDSSFMAVSGELKTLSDDFTKYCFAYSDTAASPMVSLFTATMAPVEIGKFEIPLTSLVKRFPNHKAITDALAFVKSQATASQKQSQPQTNTRPTVGSPAPELTMNDVNGNPFSLSQLRGKYVLIDFWASWCAPCRAENPNVVAAYNQFKNKNFTVLGVSLDKDKAAWLNAIKEDNLAWQQISDLKYWSSSAVGLYGIDGIPYNVLIDPQGKIIATGLRESGLQKKLTEVLK